MAPAFLPIARAASLLAALATASAFVAAGSLSREGGERRVTSSFTLLYTTAAKPPTVVPSNGVGIAPSKPVVSNPYNVPLIQNAGSLGSIR